MILKVIPYILILFPLIGFFVDPASLGTPKQSNAIHNLAMFVFTLPWWGKLISILIGIFWAIGQSTDKEESQQ
jgi:hypothetical protein